MMTLSVAGPLIMKDNILRVMQNACLVLHVYCEKLKDDSFWKPYLGILASAELYIIDLFSLINVSPNYPRGWFVGEAAGSNLPLFPLPLPSNLSSHPLVIMKGSPRNLFDCLFGWLVGCGCCCCCCFSNTTYYPNVAKLFSMEKKHFRSTKDILSII